MKGLILMKKVLIILFVSLLLAACDNNLSLKQYENDQYIQEKYIVTEKNENAIAGKMVNGKHGLYLDDTYNNWDFIKNVGIGDKINVFYKIDDIEKGIFDNIVHAEVAK
jgi:hypothetical protein